LTSSYSDGRFICWLKAEIKRLALFLAGALLLVPGASLAYEDDQERERPQEDTNSCIEGTIAGGLVGAGLGAVVTQGTGRWLGVPVGAVGGALLGCQIDGG